MSQNVKVLIYQNDLAASLTHRTDTHWNFFAFQTTLGFLCTTQHFKTFLFDLSIWFFKMELNPFLDLLNTGFTIIVCFVMNIHRKLDMQDQLPRLSLTRWHCLITQATFASSRICMPCRKTLIRGFGPSAYFCRIKAKRIVHDYYTCHLHIL